MAPETDFDFFSLIKDDVVNFKDFVRVLAHFRPIKKNADKNPLNSREDKLRCECLCRIL